MYPLIRTALFAMDGEAVHDLALAGLRAYGALPGRLTPFAGRKRSLLGLEFRNPVGLAAGLDKDARAIEGLARLGFGFVEVGTVTPRPQPGNPRPRLFRLPRSRGLINRMGFNNRGVAAMAAELAALRQRDRLGGTIVGVNVGKNKDTPLENAVADYQLCIEAVYPFADYLTLNLSSPNTPGLRSLQSGAALTGLLGPVKDTASALAARHRRRVPVLVKIAPDLVREDLELIAAAVRDFELDGVIATNTTITRPGLDPAEPATEAGGLSGAPLKPLAQAVVAEMRALLGPEVPLIGVGGIMNRADGAQMLDLGADLLQIYTGFIYEGPALIRALSTL
ncbi:MAG: quinone-dependent dihydroorotate dehydrogenase [Pseudomonadales bacterium]